MSDKSPKELERLIEQSRRLARGSDAKTVAWLHKLTESWKRNSGRGQLARARKIKAPLFLSTLSYTMSPSEPTAGKQLR